MSYYIYGFGGSAYYSPNNDSDKLTLNTLFATLQTPDLIKGFQIDADWASVYGVKHVAYEGGPSLDNTGHSEAIKATAVKDARMTNAMIAIHNAWTANGGGLLNYCCGNGDYQWGFTDNINNLDTPKFRAIDQLNQGTPAALTYGTMVPASIKAGNWSIMSGSLTNNENPITLKPLVFNTSFDPNAVYWIAYTIRADTADSYQFSVTYFSNQTGQLKVIVDGNPLEPVNIQNTNGADQTTLPLKITLGVGLHSVRLQSTQGQFRVRTLHFN